MDATVFFEVYDEAYPFDGDPEISMLSAVVHAPFSQYQDLCGLSREDTDAVLSAMQTVWPFTETDREAISQIAFQLDVASLDEGPLVLIQETSGWSQIDKSLEHIRARLADASDGEAYAEVGVLCRRVLVELGRTISDPDKYPPLDADDANASPDDVKRVVRRFLAVEAAGPSQQSVRQCVRSAVDLAGQLVHGTNATHRDALLCAQATFNAVGLMSILSHHN